MRSLKNVGEIREVFRVGDNINEIQDVAENIQGYDFQGTVNDLMFLNENISENKIPDISDTNWEYITSETKSNDTLTLKRSGKHIPTMFAYIWFNNDLGTAEVGISYKRPQKAWIKQAKEEFKDESKNQKQRSKNKIDKKQSEEIEENSVLEDGKGNEDDDKVTDKKSDEGSNISYNSINKEETDISKEQVKILIKSRLANILHASDSYINKNNQELSDYYYIKQGYPKIALIIKEIYDEKSLRENIDKLPYNFSEYEINTMLKKSDVSGSNKESKYENANNLETVLEE